MVIIGRSRRLSNDDDHNDHDYQMMMLMMMMLIKWSLRGEVGLRQGCSITLQLHNWATLCIIDLWSWWSSSLSSLSSQGPGRRAKMGLSFEYSLTVWLYYCVIHTPCFAHAALSSVEVSGNMGNDKSHWTFQPSTIPTFYHSNLPTFQSSNLLTV